MSKQMKHWIVVGVLIILCLGTLGVVPAHAQKVSASAKVTKVEHSKNVGWTGKAIAEITVAEMMVEAGDPFVKGTASAGTEGVWSIPINSDKQAQFKGLLLNESKYSPSFNGDFETGGGGRSGTQPVWNVGTMPEIVVSTDHEYLNFERGTNGNVTLAHSRTLNIIQFVVDCPVGTLSQVNGVIKGEMVEDFRGMAGGGRFIGTAEVKKDSISLTPAQFASCPCRKDANCSGAVKITIPVTIDIKAFDWEIRYPTKWKQDLGDPDKDNISAAARADSKDIMTRLKAHEERHRSDLAAVVVKFKDSLKSSWEFEACGKNRETSIAMITDVFTQIDEKTEEDLKDSLRKARNCLDTDNEVDLLESEGIPCDNINREEYTYVSHRDQARPGGDTDRWSKTYLHKDGPAPPTPPSP